MATTRKSTTTSTKSTTKAKSTAPKTKTETSVTAAAKSAIAPTPSEAEPVVVESPQPVVTGPVMRKRELIDAVVALSNIKKKDAKPVIEAMLAVLGSALQDGRELNLQPMGKIKVNREKKLAEGKVLIARIRQARDLPASEVAADKETGIELSTDTDAPAAAE